jgi:hypothetical protein
MTQYFPRHIGTKTAVSGISYEKIVQEKDPGNHVKCAYSAWSLVGGCNAGVRAEAEARGEMGKGARDG